MCDKCEFSDSATPSPPFLLWPASAQDFLFTCDDFLCRYPSVNFLPGLHEEYDQHVHVPFDKLAGHRGTLNRGECPTCSMKRLRWRRRDCFMRTPIILNTDSLEHCAFATHPRRARYVPKWRQLPPSNAVEGTSCGTLSSTICYSCVHHSGDLFLVFTTA